jgi:hypothetical protein
VAHLSRPLLTAVPLLAGLALVAHSAAAQPATGSVTGRVLWSPCLRGIPLPLTPDAQGQPAQPDAGAQPQPGPGVRPIPVNGLPAGAVLVAIQNTNVSARTDEAGRFTLSGVPAGQYLSVAAGPVANSAGAIAERPNVFVDAGQSVDIGTLSLGGGALSIGDTTSLAIACRGIGIAIAPGVQVPAPDDAPGNPNP